ncbi:hypothetical protein HaLaN_12901 [Haematococcus lacustris]|uniref:Uncharacterized protein n=1 Tax=Haematococcus lacustris TaxID=44745 RepID=A0A699ZB76_HAELA|nr:hypothetical protein HaLaN_12901 [Haematococcus lacustris]
MASDTQCQVCPHGGVAQATSQAPCASQGKQGPSKAQAPGHLTPHTSHLHMSAPMTPRAAAARPCHPDLGAAPPHGRPLPSPLLVWCAAARAGWPSWGSAGPQGGAAPAVLQLGRDGGAGQQAATGCAALHFQRSGYSCKLTAIAAWLTAEG